MRITLIDEHGHADVWVSLDGTTGDPREMSESFIIGCGDNRERAIASALVELDAAKIAVAALNVGPTT